MGCWCFLQPLLTPVSPESAFLAFYGIDGVGFTALVKIGDTIHTEGEVIDKKGRGEYSGVVTTRNCVKNQRGENVAVWDLRVLIAKRGKGT